MKHETFIIIPDLHVPFACQKYLLIIEKLIKKLQPTGIVQLGDALDFFQVSSYSKDPLRKNRVYEDLQAYAKILDRWEDLLPKDSEIHQLCGNHENRCTRWIWERCPELAEMFKSIPDSLEFKERNKRGKVWYQWHEYNKWDSCKIGDTTFFHGFYFNQHVAMGNLAKYNCNSISGHTHRFQHVSNGRNWAVSLGHGSDEKKTAHSPVPTGWQQMLGVYTVVKGKGHLETISIKDGFAVFRGVVL
jgi:hypothetical protein